MINIDSVYSDLKDLIRKNQGGYVSPGEFNRLAQLASIERFNDLYGNDNEFRYDKPTARKAYPVTKSIGDSLSKFIEVINTAGPITSAPVPSDSVEVDSISHKYTEESVAKEVPVRWVSSERFNVYRNHVIETPTDEFPIYTRQGDMYIFLPSLQEVSIKYLRLPQTPVWAYTVVGNRPVYDPLTSVDFEWDESDRNDIVFRIASMAGLTIKDGDVINYSEAKANQ